LETAGHNTLAVVVLDNNLGNGTSPASTTVKLSADNSGFYGLWMVKRGQLQISNELALGFDRTWNIATVNHPDNAEVYIWDEGRVILTPDSTTVSNNPWLIDNRFLSLADDGVTLRPYTNLRNDSEAHGSLVIQGTGNDTSVSLAGDNTSFYGHIQVLRGNLIFERPTAQGQGDIEIGANGTVRFRVNIAAGTPFANPVWSIGNDIFGEGDLHIDYVDHAFASRFNSATWNAAGNGTRAANDPTMGKVKLNNNNNLSDTHRLSGKVWLDKGILELGHPDAAGIGEISLASGTTLEIHNVLEDSAVVTLQDQPYGNYSDDWTSWVESTYATTTNDAWELDNYITGAGQIVKDQHGILQIGSATREVNTYSGGTMISDGVVRTVGSQALGSGAVTMNSGMLDLYNTNLNLAGLQGAGGIVWLRGWENADPIFPAIKPVEAGRTLTINVANAATTYLFQGFITDRSSLTDLTDYVVRPDLVSGTNLGGNLVKNGAGSFV
jgi:hypothetical protein